MVSTDFASTHLPASEHQLQLRRAVLASTIAGGPAPLIATWLFEAYHMPYAIAIYIGLCAALSLIATAMMTDYTGQDISGEYQK